MVIDVQVTSRAGSQSVGKDVHVLWRVLLSIDMTQANLHESALRVVNFGRCMLQGAINSIETHSR